MSFVKLNCLISRVIFVWIFFLIFWPAVVVVVVQTRQSDISQWESNFARIMCKYTKFSIMTYSFFRVISTKRGFVASKQNFRHSSHIWTCGSILQIIGKRTDFLISMSIDTGFSIFAITFKGWVMGSDTRKCTSFRSQFFKIQIDRAFSKFRSYLNYFSPEKL